MSLHWNFELTEEVEFVIRVLLIKESKPQKQAPNKTDFVFVATENMSSMIEFILNLNLNTKKWNQGFVKIA